MEKAYNNLKGGIFTGYVRQRINKNKNFMACITGPTGSGKTYTALSFAEQLDPSFDVSRVVFTPKEFIDLLNSKTLKKGSVIVADEFGVSMNSRNWQSVANQVINYVLQTFRSKNYIVLFTSPDFGFIDVSARKLFHAHIMTQGINFEDKLCSVKPFMLQINQRNGDIYYKYLPVEIKGHQTKKVKEIKFTLPSKQLIKDYEIKKDLFVTELNVEIESKLNESKEKTISKKDRQDIKDDLIWEQVQKKEQQGIMQTSQQARELGLPRTTLTALKERMTTKQNLA